MTRLPMVEARKVVQMLPGGAGPVTVLREVSLSLFAGDLTLLSGPSGSGKTTLLSILGCLRRPTQGTLSIMGENVTGYDAGALARVRRLRIGFVFQHYNLFPALTARENLRLALDACDWDGADPSARVEHVLAEVGLTARGEAKPAAMSGGEQQRLAIGRAIAAGAPVILADEPTSALDARNGQIVMELLTELAHRRSATVLAVTHDPRTEPYADRMVRIEDGAITQDERRKISSRLTSSRDYRHE
ncbi:ABC transporter ATP-binding protein [Zavarzinia compransoris]|uniref:ABC transporter ATP-binding protein n=1 Tax=Zavarzinia compransoris TaxID=1264899 RepID=A0A317E8Z5_9PROT|nr:ABC transporter ATP-binding protein [Zavarzinia compransoris]PWR23052.1 ABC transporter ATP-binding protein [Zavarzinia compransoris]TDP46403.1 putative ABC transport system ATP-binding protein [Zavarzinia compransoris]